MKTETLKLHVVTFGLSLMACAALSGCGRSDVVYQGASPEPVIVTQVSPTPTPLPLGVYDLSVNNASSMVVNNSGLTVLQMNTTGGASTAGSFNDTNAVGNRAIVGFATTGAPLLNQFPGLNFTVKYTEGSAQLNVLLNIQLVCGDTSTSYVLTTKASALQADSSGVDANGYEKFWAPTFNGGSYSAAVWLVRGSSNIPDLTSGNPPVLYKEQSGIGKSLDDLVSSGNYPNACIVDGFSSDPGLSHQKSVTGVMVTLGDEANISQNTALVKEFKLGPDDVYNDWSAP